MLQEPAHCPKDINMCETSVRFKPGTPVGICTKKAKDRMRFFSFALFLIERVPYTACITVVVINPDETKLSHANFEMQVRAPYVK